MSYIGAVAPAYDPTRATVPQLDAERFSGNASTTAFTLTRQVVNPTDIDVFVENVRQEPTTAYNIDGLTLTFTSAPGTGTNNIYVIYRASGVSNYAFVPDGSITYAKLANNIRQFTVDNFTANGTGTTVVLSETPASANTLVVAIDGVIQTAPENFSLSGTTITFTSAPDNGSNVTVRHLGFRTTSTVTALTAGSVTTTELADGSVTNAKIVSVANTKITGVLTAAQLANTAVTPAVYGGATAVPVLTIDQQGRITSASNVSVTATSNGMFTYVSSAIGALPDTGGTITPIKILGQIQTTANTLTNAYVVGAATESIVSTVTVCNQSANNVLVDVFARPGGTALGNQHYLVYQYVLGAADTLVLEPRLTMNATSVLAANVTGANAASNVSVNVFGIEVL